MTHRHVFMTRNYVHNSSNSIIEQGDARATLNVLSLSVKQYTKQNDVLLEHTTPINNTLLDTLFMCRFLDGRNTKINPLSMA